MEYSYPHKVIWNRNYLYKLPLDRAVINEFLNNIDIVEQNVYMPRLRILINDVRNIKLSYEELIGIFKYLPETATFVQGELKRVDYQTAFVRYHFVTPGKSILASTYIRHIGDVEYVLDIPPV